MDALMDRVRGFVSLGPPRGLAPVMALPAEPTRPTTPEEAELAAIVHRAAVEAGLRDPGRVAALICHYLRPTLDECRAGRRKVAELGAAVRELGAELRVLAGDAPGIGE